MRFYQVSYPLPAPSAPAPSAPAHTAETLVPDIVGAVASVTPINDALPGATPATPVAPAAPVIPTKKQVCHGVENALSYRAHLISSQGIPADQITVRRLVVERAPVPIERLNEIMAGVLAKRAERRAAAEAQRAAQLANPTPGVAAEPSDAHDAGDEDY